MILSDKSSGSSILQAVLADYPQINVLEPGNFHCESRYWMYAAAILDSVRQPPMQYSHEFPARKKWALKRLNLIMEKGKTGRVFHKNSEKSEFHAGWLELCRSHAPVFLEKSPHHLHSRAALELILEFRLKYSQVQTRFIGLIRNPMDTLYSMYRRWYAIPENRQFEWLRAYRNLEWMKAQVGKDLLTVRYEDLIGNPATLGKICTFCGIEYPRGSDCFSPEPVHRWKKDPWWGFEPAQKIKRFAGRYYNLCDLVPASSLKLWPVIRLLKKPGYRLLMARRNLKKVLKSLESRWRGGD